MPQFNSGPIGADRFGRQYVLGQSSIAGAAAFTLSAVRIRSQAIASAGSSTATVSGRRISSFPPSSFTGYGVATVQALRIRSQAIASSGTAVYNVHGYRTSNRSSAHRGSRFQHRPRGHPAGQR
jgi:hypothetical protein